jgi:TrpR-related protein YerC/YecD
MTSTTVTKNIDALGELFEALLLLENKDEVACFVKDLCTPQEISLLAERWRVCQLLEQGTLSYREIHRITGASLVTIGRVSRFLKNEPFQGYKIVLDKIKKKKAAAYDIEKSTFDGKCTYTGSSGTLYVP